MVKRFRLFHRFILPPPESRQLDGADSWRFQAIAFHQPYVVRGLERARETFDADEPEIGSWLSSGLERVDARFSLAIIFTRSERSSFVMLLVCFPVYGAIAAGRKFCSRAAAH